MTKTDALLVAVLGGALAALTYQFFKPRYVPYDIDIDAYPVILEDTYLYDMLEEAIRAGSKRGYS